MDDGARVSGEGLSGEPSAAADSATAVPAPATAGPVPLGDGWSAALTRQPGGVLLRVGRGASDQTLEITISLTADGPVVRARAAALEIETEHDLVARCDRFRVEARHSVELISGDTLRAQGRRVEVEATHGTARIEANDDVQLLGENVLLNCDRPPPPVPAWARPGPAAPEPTLPAQPASGDPALLAALAGDGSGEEGR